MGYEKEGVFVTGIHELHKVPDPSARIGMRYVFEQLYPGEEIVLGYETEFYEYDMGDKKIGTRPDISVYFPNDKVSALETTRSKKRWCIQSLQSLPVWLGKTDVVFSERGGIDLLPIMVQYDPKSKQKRVMQAVAPNITYDVWYKEDLLEIERLCYKNSDASLSDNLA